jgi:hypothetical protein
MNGDRLLVQEMLQTTSFTISPFGFIKSPTFTLIFNIIDSNKFDIKFGFSKEAVLCLFSRERLLENGVS